jgi:hypothetical protein
MKREIRTIQKEDKGRGKETERKEKAILQKNPT